VCAFVTLIHIEFLTKKPRSKSAVFDVDGPAAWAGRRLDFRVSGAFRLALQFESFKLVFIIVGIALVVKHADQYVLLMDIPDVNPVAYRLVGHMLIVAFSYFYSHLLAPISG
jgi:hypothetical protein